MLAEEQTSSSGSDSWKSSWMDNVSTDLNARHGILAKAAEDKLILGRNVGLNPMPPLTQSLVEFTAPWGPLLPCPSKQHGHSPSPS